MIKTDNPIIFEEFESKRQVTDLFSDERKLHEDWDGIDDRDCYITLKTIPNTFKSPLSSTIDYPCVRNILHLYKVQVKFLDDRFFSLGGSTSELLYLTLKALNDIGLAFKNKLSIDIVDYDYDLFLMDAVLKMNLIYMGEYEVNEKQLHHIQRFHKAVACQEDIVDYNDLSNQHAGYYDFLNINEINKNSTEWVLNDEEWCRSSNGAYYLIFPFKPGSYSEYAKNESIFDLEYLEKCANEAQFTIHNLRVIGITDTSREATHVDSMKSCAILSEYDWTHLIVLANNRLLGYIATDNEKNRKSLISILKYEIVCFDNKEDSSDNMIISNVNKRNNSSKVAVTYADYLTSKHPYLALCISTKRNDSNHRLLAMNAMSTKVTHFTLLSTVQPCLQDDKGWNERRSIYSDKPERAHFMPEQCRPIGFGHWFYMIKIFPSVIHRIQSLELASEALQLISDNLVAFDDINKTLFQFDSRNENKYNNNNYYYYSINNNNNNNNSINNNSNKNSNNDDCHRHIPHLTTFLEAITPKMSLESFDSERLEFLGDTFLKFAITVELYKTKPNFNEGQLTNERVKYINNRRLCHAAIDFNLSKYIRALPLSNGHQRVEFCPPGMCDGQYLRDISIWNVDIMKFPPEFKYDVSSVYNYPVKYHKRHMVMFKKLADMVESIIGAFYIDCGISGGIRAMKSFHLWPTTKNGHSSTPRSNNHKKLDNKYNIKSNTMKSIPNTISHIPPITYYVSPIVANRFKSIPTESYYYQPIVLTSKRTMKFSLDILLENKLKQQIIENAGTQSIIEDHVLIRNYRDKLNPSIAIACDINVDYDIDNDIMKTQEVLYTHSEGNILLRKITRNINYINPSSSINNNINNNNIPDVLKPNTNKLPIMKDRKKIIELELILGYVFTNKDYLIQALTHSSASNTKNYERLEFLGDAILDFIVVTYIYNLKTKLEPGMINKLKSSHLCNCNLAKVGSKLKLQDYIIYDSLSIKKKVELINMRYSSNITTSINTQKTTTTNNNNNNSKEIVKSVVNTSIKQSNVSNESIIYSEAINIIDAVIDDNYMDIVNEEHLNQDEVDMMVESTNNINNNEHTDVMDIEENNTIYMNIIDPTIENNEIINNNQDMTENIILMEDCTTVNIVKNVNEINKNNIKDYQYDCKSFIAYEDISVDVVLADSFEAIVGAIFLDSNENIEIIQEFIQKQGLLVSEYI